MVHREVSQTFKFSKAYTSGFQPGSNFFARRHSSFLATFLIVTTGKGTGVGRVFHWPLVGIGQFSSVTQSCPTLCSPTEYSMTGFPVHHQLLEFVHTHVYQVGDAIQPSHPLSSPSSPTFSVSQHQGLFQLVSFSHQVATVL